MKKKLLLLCAIGMIASTVSARDWFVKSGASTSSAGDSWETACNISVITGSNPSGIADGDVVYLAAGDYTRSTNLTISKYITIKGGYSASLTGTDVSGRDIANNKATFAPAAGNTTRCITINATLAPSVAGQKITLDGFYMNGFAMATANSGVAVTLTTAQSDVDFKNLTFSNNISLNTTGGAFAMASFTYNGVITFDGCTFTGNQASWSSANGYGGAMYFANGATAKTINIKNCTFTNNTAYARGGVGYFAANMTVNISDCYFDSNYCTNATDNTSSGGCFYITGGTYSSTFNVTRSIFLNSSCTAKGSVFWFNTYPTNYINLTNCSLIGNYAKRTGSARAAIDADQYATTPSTTNNLTVTLNGCVLSNYNYGGSPAGKQSNKADLMYLTGTGNALASTASTFTNTILNGAYFSSSNTLDAITPSLLYQTTGYLKDSTISLALSGALKITDKIVWTKTFDAIATFSAGIVHTQIFDVKRNTSKAMQLVATIPANHALIVDGTEYSGTATINIPASGSDPSIVLYGPLATKLSTSVLNTVKYSTTNGEIRLSNLTNGSKVMLYNAAGQLVSSHVANSADMSVRASGLVIVKISSANQSQVLKVMVR